MHSRLFFTFIAFALGLSAACSASPTQAPASPSAPTTRAAATDATPALPSPLPPTATAGPALDTPEKAAQAFFEIWQLPNPNAEALLNLGSEYSLRQLGMTPEGLNADLERQIFQGLRVERFAILDRRVISEDTVLLRLAIATRNGAGQTRTADEWKAFRLEDGEWRINWNDLINVTPLAVPAQTMNGLEVQPVSVFHHTDQVKVMLATQNSSERTLLWGWANSVVATANFPTLASQDRVFQFKFSPGSAYPDLLVEFPGLFAELPNVLRLSSFLLARDRGDLPQLPANPWSYEFQLAPAP